MDEKALLSAIKSIIEENSKELKQHINQKISESEISLMNYIDKNNIAIAELVEEAVEQAVKTATNEAKKDINTLEKIVMQNTFDIAQIKAKIS